MIKYILFIYYVYITYIRKKGCLFLYNVYILIIYPIYKDNVMNDTKDKLFTAKVEENLLNAFKSACENTDTTASQAVRAFMRDYTKKHGQADLFKTSKKP